MPSITCPLCRQPLAPAGNALPGTTWRCAGGHAFDMAREGYLNLLPVQRKKSRAPGDNADMVRARREFLAAGHYAPLRAAITGLLRPLAATSLLDIGCGEGWYTAALATLVPDVTGIDIARDAVRLAAKAHPGITWLVGSSAALPLADASVDVVTSLFSPLPVAEMARVLVPGGHLLVATPAPRHLWSLRAALFDDVRPHAPEKFLAELAPAFRAESQQDVGFDLALDGTALRNLLQMTPYAWRATPERRAALEARTAFAVEAQFRVYLLRKISA